MSCLLTVQLQGILQMSSQLVSLKPFHPCHLLHRPAGGAQGRGAQGRGAASPGAERASRRRR